MRAASGSFRVAKMEGDWRSGKEVKKWTSLETIVRTGSVLWVWAVRRRAGRTFRARRKVETTFVVIVDSLSSKSLNLVVLMPGSLC